MYLEISPRGAGKTYRLIEAVKSWLALNPENKALIFCPMPRRMKENFPIKAKFLHYKSCNRGKVDSNTRRFFDEFDFYNESLLNLDILETDYFTSSPAKIRTVEDIEMEKVINNDFLLKLLRANDGQYNSFAPLHLWNVKLLKSAFSEQNESVEEKQKRLLGIEKEYHNRFYDLIKSNS